MTVELTADDRLGDCVVSQHSRGFVRAVIRRAVFLLCLGAASIGVRVLAQDKPDFSGTPIARAFADGSRSETHQIGMTGGIASGRQGEIGGPRFQYGVAWEGQTLVFEQGHYTGATPAGGNWDVCREAWSVDSEERLHVTISTRGAGKSPEKVELTYRRSVLAKAPETPLAWLGTWKLNFQRSTLDERALQIEGQLLRIEIEGDSLVLTADTTLAGGQIASEVSKVDVTGKPTPGPSGATVSFKRIVDEGFEIILRLKSPSGGEAVGTNRFEFSTDGRTLTETKIQTFSAGPATAASNARPVSSVLVFERQ